MPNRCEDSIKLAEKIVDGITYANIGPLSILKLYYRLVSSIEKQDEIEWINSELYGYKRMELIPKYRIIPKNTSECAIVVQNFGFLLNSYDNSLHIKSQLYIKYHSKNGKVEYKIKQQNSYGWDSDNQSCFIYLKNEDIDKILSIVSTRIFKKTNSILKDLNEKSTCICDVGIRSTSIQDPNCENFINVSVCPDDFYKGLINEINCLYSERYLISLSVLVRKLLENLIIDILRKKYNTSELNLYYDPSRHRFQDFSTLINNIELKLSDFQSITPNFNKEFLKNINEFRGAGNASAHSIDICLNTDYFSSKKKDLNYIIKLLMRVYNNV